MKFTDTTFFALLGILASVAAISSCSRTKAIEGTWEAAPTRISVQGAADAYATVTLDFAPAQNARTGGDVNISAVVELTQAVTTPAITIDEPWEVSVSANALINGTYVYDDGDDDDILLNLDPSTLQVNVDPDGVTYSRNILDGIPASQLDSLNAATADRWRLLITSAIRDEFNKYRKIDDIKIHHNDMMSAEINDQDYTFRRAGTQPSAE